MNAHVLDDSSPRARLLSLQGACNFRDIGGYTAQGGSTVRWGQVYRAGVLAYFTDEDHPPLTALKVRAICDLRRAEERAHEPTRWPGQSPSLLHWGDGVDMPTLRQLAAGRPSTAGGMFDAMVELYRRLPRWMAGRIRGMLECIAAGNVPLVVHCAAGKDRTGVAVAVLLRALGVETRSVIDDYLLTNEAGDFEAFIRTRLGAQLGLGDNHSPLLAMPEEMRAVLFSARPEFLEAAFEEIDGALGGLDAYLSETVGVEPATRERLALALLA